jgi:glycine/D-amino acid oxidase-like deaminating enzyme
MVLTGLKLPMREVIRRYGSERARQLFQCSLDGINLVERIVREEGIQCGFARAGHLLTASKPRHFSALEKEADFLSREFGHRTLVVARRDLPAEIASEAYFGGVVDPVSAGLNPAQYLAGLSRAAAEAGASLHARARVERLEGKPGEFVVHTARGSLRAERVLVATGGYTGGATPRLQRRIVPIGSFIIATAKLPDDLQRALIPRSRMVFDSRHFLNYFRVWDARMVFGGRAAFFPESPGTIRQSAGILRREMVRVFPQLRDVEIEYAWGGTLDFAFDLMPHVGESEGIAYCLGYAGHGVAMATYLGQVTAAGMLDGSLEKHPFASIPFPGAPLGLYNGWPWFLPLVGLSYKLRDLIE